MYAVKQAGPGFAWDFWSQRSLKHGRLCFFWGETNKLACGDLSIWKWPKYIREGFLKFVCARYGKLGNLKNLLCTFPDSCWWLEIYSLVLRVLIENKFPNEFQLDLNGSKIHWTWPKLEMADASSLSLSWEIPQFYHIGVDQIKRKLSLESRSYLCGSWNFLGVYIQIPPKHVMYTHGAHMCCFRFMKCYVVHLQQDILLLHLPQIDNR